MERVLDVSALEPPEPLALTLAAANRLAAGDYVRMLHRRWPCLLFDNLAKGGFSAELRSGRVAACEVFIWRDGDRVAEAAARAAAAELPLWRE
jgi:hypothetical protein